MAKGKLNPRQQAFVREYVKNGGNGRQAYVKAGYDASLEGKGCAADVNASRLLRSAQVQDAVVSLQRRVLTRHDYTMDKILDELDESRQAATADKQHGAAVQATTVKAKMLGMIVERKEVGSVGEFSAADSLAAVLELARKQLGEQAAETLRALVQSPHMIDVTPNSEKE